MKTYLYFIQICDFCLLNRSLISTGISPRHQNMLIFKHFRFLTCLLANVMLFTLYNLITFIITFKPLLQYKKVAFNCSEFAMSTQGFLVYYMIRYNKTNRQNLERLKNGRETIFGYFIKFWLFSQKALFYVLVRDAMYT